MPCDNQRVTVEHEEFTDTLNSLYQLMSTDNYNAFIICGDFNTSFQRNNFHTLTLGNFMQYHNLRSVWEHTSTVPSNTYVNHELNHESCIDHFLVTNNIFNCVINSFVQLSSLNPSHHYPLHLSLELPYYVCNMECTDTKPSENIDWINVNIDHISFYKKLLDNFLVNIRIDSDIMYCSNSHCDNIIHKRYIDSMCNELITCCLKAGALAFPCKKMLYTTKKIALWNEKVKPYREKSVFWHNIWMSCNRPKSGIVFDIMRKSRAQYHYAVQAIRQSESNARKEQFLLNTQYCSVNEFWYNVKRFGEHIKLQLLSSMVNLTLLIYVMSLLKSINLFFNHLLVLCLI